MDKIEECIVKSGQHDWVTLPKGVEGQGMQCYSCPMCGQLVYWSDILLGWVKPGTAGNKNIPGNNRKDSK